MKNKFLLLIIVLFTFNALQAQVCGTFPPVKDFWWGTPGDEDFAFSNDSIDLFNVDTAEVIQGQSSIADFQYLIPKKFDATALSGGVIGLVDVQTISISGITGLPAGLNFGLDQAGTNAGNLYNPQTYRYGAVRLCGTTFAAAGVYEVLISVSAVVSTPIGNQTGSLPISVYVKVVPSPGGNPFYTFAPGQGCDSVNVDFEAVVPSPNPIINPINYAWDFTNDGTMDTSGTLANYTYTNIGTQEVNMTYTIDEFYISAASMSVSDADGCFCDLYFIFACTDGPEPYLVINTGGGDVTLPAGSGTSPSWSNLDIPISSVSLAINFWEEDGGLLNGNDFFGSDIETLTSTPTNGQVLSFSVGCGSASITISRRQLSVDNFVDTINVYGQSPTPIITNLNGAPIACLGDTVTLESSVAGSYQWYKDSLALGGETNQTLTVTTSGLYSLEVIDSGNICLSEQGFYDMAFEELVASIIDLTSTGGLFVDNPNGYTLQWFANGSGIAVPIPAATSDTLANFNPANAPFTVSFTSAIGCEALSAPFDLCLEGTSTASGTTISLGNSVTLTHDNFILKPGNDVAWAISTEADGAVTDMASLQAAISAGWVLPSDDSTGVTVDCSSIPADLDNGNYYFTPISAAALLIDSIIHFPSIDSGCVSDAQLCLDLSATPGVLLITDSLIFTFPDGSTAGLRDIVPASFQALLPDTINEGLIALLPSFVPGGALCFAFTDIYAGDPNGTWSISALNVGTGTLTIDVDDIISTVYADSCPVITVDQVITIPGLTFTIGGNTSASVSFTLPPIPANFPTINSDCNVFGSATLLTVNCATGIRDLVDLNSFNIYPNPNNGSFTVTLDVLERSEMNLAIYDVTGRRVLANSYPNVNKRFSETFDLANNMSAGFYVLNIEINGNQIQKHFIVK